MCKKRARRTRVVMDLADMPGVVPGVWDVTIREETGQKRVLRKETRKKRHVCLMYLQCMSLRIRSRDGAATMVFRAAKRLQTSQPPPGAAARVSQWSFYENGRREVSLKLGFAVGSRASSCKINQAANRSPRFVASVRGAGLLAGGALQRLYDEFAGKDVAVVIGSNSQHTAQRCCRRKGGGAEEFRGSERKLRQGTRFWNLWE